MALRIILAAAAAAAASEPVTFARYIVVGAGPGGLQMAHYLESAGRDYLVLDRAADAGSFFARYPRWRQLISINKAVTGGHQLDFVSRQDWNSLLPEHSTSNHAHARSFNFSRVPCLLSAATTGGGPRVSPGEPGCEAADYSSTDAQYTTSSVSRGGLRFTELTSDYYPHADVLHEYLRGWPKADTPRGAVGPGDVPSGAALRAEYGVFVERVARPAGYAAALASAGGSQSALIAAGTPRFRLTAADGRVYECVTLLWAAGLQAVVAPQSAGVAEHAMTYQSHPTSLETYANKTVMILGRGNAAFEVASHIMGVTARVHVYGRTPGRVRLSTETHYPGDVRHVHSRLLEAYLLKSQDALAEIPFEEMRLEPHADGSGRLTTVFGGGSGSSACDVDEHGRLRQRCAASIGYDVVISASGWKFDVRPFDAEVRPPYARNRKHPALTAGYGSPGVAGLYFCGTVAHAADHRVSSGGFIHGFRYVVRALHRHLEEVEQAAAMVSIATTPPPLSPPPAAWPRRRMSGLRATVSALLRRANNAAGLFQMFQGSLVDVLVLPPLTAPADGCSGGAGLVLTPLVDPSSFPDPTVSDPLLGPQLPRGWAGATDAQQDACDAAVEAALAGSSLFEEVPIRLVHLKVPGWAAQAATTTGAATEYITLALEFGGRKYAGRKPGGSAYDYGLPSITPPADGDDGDAAPQPTHTPTAHAPPEDPYDVDRANTSFFDPERSRFLHPVLRYYHTGLQGKAAGADAAAIAIPPPLLEMHLLEDFEASYVAFAGYVLAVARFLQDVGARRIAAAHALAELPAGAGDSDVRDALASAFASARTADGDAPSAAAVAHVRTVMSLAGEATLHFRGHEVHAGESWHHYLSTVATADLLSGTFATLTTHWWAGAADLLVPADAALVRSALATVGRAGRGGDTSATSADGDALLYAHLLRAFYRNATAADPDLAVLVLRADANSNSAGYAFFQQASVPSVATTNVRTGVEEVDAAGGTLPPNLRRWLLTAAGSAARVAGGEAGGEL